ncbi:STAS domain-containing protein [Motilibacter deserti]|uniref:STAS domain-containing protein n=1 Tax=Motilibacter deserti TaxID=2714956 RepID=A0ABX0GV73_9ACTN|nr:STAS domain-containing protein [Motilibacter deserti]NHC14824.1 STAS domain-containing protein [Motilibacter deserti]
MRTERRDTSSENVLAVGGDVLEADAQRLASVVLDAVNAHDDRRDVMIDAHGVTAFPDSAFWALVRGRSRAKWKGRRLVVLDSPEGVLARHIRSHGQQDRLPVYADAAVAATALSQARRVLREGVIGFGKDPS